MQLVVVVFARSRESAIASAQRRDLPWPVCVAIGVDASSTRLGHLLSNLNTHQPEESSQERTNDLESIILETFKRMESEGEGGMTHRLPSPAW